MMRLFKVRPGVAVIAALVPALAACSAQSQRWSPQFPSPGPGTAQAAPTGPVMSQQLPPPGGPTDLGGEQAGAEPMGEAPAQMAALPAPTGPLTREDVLGQWTLAGPGDRCQVFVALTSWQGGYRASTRGCTAPELTNVGAWNIEGNLVVLKDNDGNPLARLARTAATRYEGRLELGGAVSMSR